MKLANEETSGAFNREVIVGLFCCFLVCIAAVIARGVRWDETWEYARIMTGQAPYPPGHPMLCYLFGAYSLPNYLSAGILWLGFGPSWICGLRNVLFLFATAAPVFLITLAISRNFVWGFAASLLAVSGIYLEFDGSYPLMTWPQLYSNGHIGGGWALLTLGLLISGRSCAAFFMAGLMPCIHVGQAAALLAMIVLYFIAEAIWGDREKIKWLALSGVAGAAISVGFFLLQKQCFTVPMPLSGLYFSSDDADAIWRSYTAHHDIHRQWPPVNGEIALVGMLLLCACWLWNEFRELSLKKAPFHRNPATLISCYVVLTAALVWGMMGVHAILGERMPFILIGWMPYRLINHVAPIILCASMGIIAKRAERPAQIFIIAALLYFLLLPHISGLMEHSIYERYFSRGDGVLFCLYGAALGAEIYGARKRVPWLIIGAAGVAALGWVHHFGAACVILGALLSMAACYGHVQFEGVARIFTHKWIALALCSLLTFATFASEIKSRAWLPTTEFDKKISRYLEERGANNSMLVGPPDEFMLQARTGHPVFAEAATASYLTYMPELGPAFQKMMLDVYGRRYDQASDADAAPWEKLWSDRTEAEWRRLSDDYRFRYVVVYGKTALKLPVAFRDKSNTLYMIPSK